jgi:RNA recognition motif-containing protein
MSQNSNVIYNNSQSNHYAKDLIIQSLNDGTIAWGDIPMEDNNNTYIPPYNGIKTLIVRNLPRNITHKILQEIFIKYGPIRDIYIPKNMNKNSPYYETIKGFALIKFFSADDARRAYIGLLSLIIHNNRCTIEFAKCDR